MIVMVMDGQGGGIGAAIIKGLRESLSEEVEILALGTNSIATSRRMKAGTNRGARGETAMMHTSLRVDVIVGPLAILMPNAMMGEVRIVGFRGDPRPHLVNQIVQMKKET